MMRIIQTGCRAHAAEIEAKGWPTADAQEAERRKKEMDAQAKAAQLAALMRPEHKVRRLRGA